ncbi:potassium channel family protein [Rhizohabitans arisaemae]|uniref:potassium channel family protein n=1 Tax=Rhizohabitans arisaemae TaxID=2720610 RepID=UPI0024B0E54B|nr:potassium channel family protein [Rhizohabitans arisaemae]
MNEEAEAEGTAPQGVRLPQIKMGPLRAVLRRLFYAGIVLGTVFLLVALDLDGYRDNADNKVSLLDALYYATVTVSTTGYGDITPVSDMARLVNIVAITPLRVVFLVILVGTTLEVLTRRTQEQIRITRWRSRVHDHTVIIGYGTKGRSAVRALLAAGRTHESLVVIDPRATVISLANTEGLTGVVGDATRSEVLKQAEVPRAKQIIIAVQRDDTAALATLTARQLNPTATIVAAVREAENDPLLRQSGANEVITSSEAAGRMMGVATESPAVISVIEDLLVTGKGLDLHEREILPGEVGEPPSKCSQIVLAVVRDGEIMHYDDLRAARLLPGDRLVVVDSVY